MRDQIAAEDVEAVAITINPRWLTVCDIPAPATGLEAKFSYRLTAAMALTGMSTGALETFSDAACTDPALTALRDRVVVTPDAALSETAARVSVGLSDGRKVAAGHDLMTPMSQATRRDRLRAKATALLGRGRADRLWDAVRDRVDLRVLTGILADPG